MDALGSISSYVASMQQLQLSIVKQSQEAQQQLVEILSDAARSVPVSSDKGGSLDISV